MWKADGKRTEPFVKKLTIDTAIIPAQGGHIFSVAKTHV
jgi:hypothetical protein